jgi:hypothetical protein
MVSGFVHLPPDLPDRPPPNHPGSQSVIIITLPATSPPPPPHPYNPRPSTTKELLLSTTHILFCYLDKAKVALCTNYIHTSIITYSIYLIRYQFSIIAHFGSKYSIIKNRSKIFEWYHCQCHAVTTHISTK